jgi:hypothetical protein
MPETTSAVPAKPEEKKGGVPPIQLAAAGLIVLMAGVIYGLVRTIRNSPCYQHADGEPPLVKVAEESAKLHLTDRPLPTPTIPLVEVPSDEAVQAPQNGHVDTLPRTAPNGRKRPVKDPNGAA